MLLPLQASAGVSVPMMAHPSWRSQPRSDLSFAEFLDRCLSDGTRHLKLDFKDAAAVEPCFQLLEKRWRELQVNGQAVWLNADVLPGPNKRGPVGIPASLFIPLWRRYCPQAFLSLGWCVGPIGPEQSYSAQDVTEMASICAEYSLAGETVVFAVSVRLAERALMDVASILQRVPDSQLLLWTGTGEASIKPTMLDRVQAELKGLGFAHRVGYDVAIARTALESGTAGVIDCSFFWSRWTRFLCCGQLANDHLLLSHREVGEQTPLVMGTTPTSTPSKADPVLRDSHDNGDSRGPVPQEVCVSRV